MVVSDMRINTVDHAGIRVATECRDNVGVHACDEFVGYPSVAEIILSIPLAKLWFEFSESTFDGLSSPGNATCVSQNWSSGILLGSLADDLHSSGSRDVNCSGSFFALGFFGGKNPEVVFEIDVASFQGFNFLRSTAAVVGDDEELLEFVVGNEVEDVVEFVFSDYCGSLLSFGLLHVGDGIGVGVAHLDGPVHCSLHARNRSSPGGGVPGIGEPLLKMAWP